MNILKGIRFLLSKINFVGMGLHVISNFLQSKRISTKVFHKKKTIVYLYGLLFTFFAKLKITTDH